MRKIMLVVAFMAVITANAQIVDTFDTNEYGWTETSADDGEALIMDGKMHVEGKNSESRISTHCYAPLDIENDFEIKCDAFVKSVSEKNEFGLIVNYRDDYNFIVFRVTEGAALYERFVDGKLVGRFGNTIKLKSQKKTELKLGLKSTFNKLEFYVNDMKALELRYFPLETTGVGFYVYGKQSIDFDNLEFIQ